jgi:hypothetical protein
MNKVARMNLRVKLGDAVVVYQCLDIRYGTRVHIQPLEDSLKGLTGNLFDVYLKPYFLDGTSSSLFLICRIDLCYFQHIGLSVRVTIS